MCASPRCTGSSRTSRRFTRRSSACAMRAASRAALRSSRTRPHANGRRRAPPAATSCRCCRPTRRPTTRIRTREARNERSGSALRRPLMFSDFDRFAMQRALTLAARGLESTDPNPRVGCVIAQRGRIIAEGWHERAGEAHAEVVALRAAGAQARGADVYITLEPCSHHGRTPPCVEALAAARVARVVYAMADPNPQVDGRGAAALAAAGIEVAAGLLGPEAAELNAGFVKRMRHGRPLVRVKLAMSLDGRTALANGESRWITGEAARGDVQHWRARSSAVLTGVGTVLADDPRLDVRLADEPPGRARRQPLRVVLDTQLRTPPAARLLQGGGEVLILTGVTGPDDARAVSLAARGARLDSLPTAAGRLALPAVLDRL